MNGWLTKLWLTWNEMILLLILLLRRLMTLHSAMHEFQLNHPLIRAIRLLRGLLLLSLILQCSRCLASFLNSWSNRANWCSKLLISRLDSNHQRRSSKLCVFLWFIGSICLCSKVCFIFSYCYASCQSANIAVSLLLRFWRWKCRYLDQDSKTCFPYSCCFWSNNILSCL